MPVSKYLKRLLALPTMSDTWLVKTKKPKATPKYPKYFKSCDLCEVGTGTSRQYRPVERGWKVSHKWVWIPHAEPRLYKWNKKVTRTFLDEYKRNNKYYYRVVTKTYYPKYICGGCREKLTGEVLPYLRDPKKEA